MRPRPRQPPHHPAPLRAPAIRGIASVCPRPGGRHCRIFEKPPPRVAREFRDAGSAVFLAGYCAFINLYSPQSILPLLSHEFGASAAEVSTIITVSTLAVALTAPFTGAVADVLGRKRVIVAAMFVLVVPTVMVAFAPTLPALVFWRFVQGLVLPPIFAVTIAYIGEEWPRHEATTAAGIYTSGASLGGFSGRFIHRHPRRPDRLARRLRRARADHVRRRHRGRVLLPRERKFVRSEGLAASAKQMLRHFRNRQLLATYAVGFGVLFNFIATFTYVSFLPRRRALQSLGQLARRDFRRLSGRLGAYAVDRLGGRALRAAALHDRGDRACGWPGSR